MCKVEEQDCTKEHNGEEFAKALRHADAGFWCWGKLIRLARTTAEGDSCDSRTTASLFTFNIAIICR